MGGFIHFLSLDAKNTFGKSLKNLYMGFRATLNFQNFKVALNPLYRFFKTLPQLTYYQAYQNCIK